MSAPWTGIARPAASSQALVSILAPGQGQVPRLQNFSYSVASLTSISTLFQILDGSTVLLELTVALASGALATLVAQQNLDYRSSAGNSMTVGFPSGISLVTQKVNVNGDFVQIGVPAFAAPVQT